MIYAFNRQQAVLTPLGRSFRAPRRISVTLPNDAYQRLVNRSDEEGRSLSNLAAFLLETALGG